MLNSVKPVSQDPQIYFGDQDYSEYRELICFERPVAFVLHYFYGYQHSRLWLYDRFDFELKDSSLIPRANALADFFKSSRFVEEKEMSLDKMSFDRLIEIECGPAAALIVPYYSVLAGTSIASSVLVERAGEGLISVTSLRGDLFYVRKVIPVQELESKLLLGEGKLSYFKVRIPDGISENARMTPRQVFEQKNIRKLFRERREVFVDGLASAHLGHRALEKAVRMKTEQFQTWRILAAEGFENVLLVRFFWPLQFAYQPFLIFLSYVLRENLGSSLWSQDQEEKITGYLHGIQRQASIASNLAVLFGKQPNERFYRSFVNKVREICEIYGQLENELLKDETSC